LILVFGFGFGFGFGLVLDPGDMARLKHFFGEMRSTSLARSFFVAWNR
jgi:hypothetical protein